MRTGLCPGVNGHVPTVGISKLLILSKVAPAGHDKEFLREKELQSVLLLFGPLPDRGGPVTQLLVPASRCQAQVLLLESIRK